MRKNSSQLQELVNHFVQQNRKGSLLGNILFNRYLKNPSSLKNVFSREDMQHFLSMRDYFIQYAERNKLDWLLLAAQAFQESRFEQSVASRAGAVGVMQIKPSTAREVGVQNVRDLESNIKAGARYHRFLIDQYFTNPSIDSLNAGLFALAAYNAGPSRIQRLRREAARKGLDNNRWFGQVELLVARDIGRETIDYVSNIYKYYISYRSLNRYMQRTGELPFEGW